MHVVVDQAEENLVHGHHYNSTVINSQLVIQSKEIDRVNAYKFLGNTD